MSKSSRHVFNRILEDNFRRKILVNLYNKWIDCETPYSFKDVLPNFDYYVNPIKIVKNEITNEESLVYENNLLNKNLHDTPYSCLYLLVRLMRNFYGQRLNPLNIKHTKPWYWYHNRYVIQYYKSLNEINRNKWKDIFTINRNKDFKYQTIPCYYLFMTHTCKLMNKEALELYGQFECSNEHLIKFIASFYDILIKEEVVLSDLVEISESKN